MQRNGQKRRDIQLSTPNRKKRPKNKITKKYIELNEDGSLKVKRSRYIDDMMGVKNGEYINKSNEME